MTISTGHRLKRRAIPFAFAGAVVVMTALPLAAGWLERPQAIKYALLFCTIVFLFKAALFSVMRARMTTKQRELTVFGTALVDVFTGLITLAVVFAAVFGVLFYLADTRGQQPSWFRITYLSAIAGAGSLIIATGVAVLYEMRRVGGDLAVHEDSRRL